MAENLVGKKNESLLFKGRKALKSQETDFNAKSIDIIKTNNILFDYNGKSRVLMHKRQQKWIIMNNTVWTLWII